MNSNSQPELGTTNRLPRSLNPIETYGFGLAGIPGWTGVVPGIHNVLGAQAVFVWFPVTFIGVLINYQVKHLGMGWIDVAGGTPNYISRLLSRYPLVARYAAIGYLLNWVSTISLNAIILTDLVNANLKAFGVMLPDWPVRIGFMTLPFILALSGTRALSILLLFFILPSIGLMVAFSVQGVGWLVFSPESPGFFPSSWGTFNFVDWAKWFYFATFVTYSSETASSFVADSRRPVETLRFLDFAAWTGAIVFILGSWVVTRLAPGSLLGKDLGDDPFANLVAASVPFWGPTASLIITFLLASSCLLTIATAVSNCPRILYQLSLDKYLAPVFGVVSRQGVFGPALTLVLVLSVFFLLWGDVNHIVVVGNVGWFLSFTLLHLSLWLQRGRPGVLAPWWSLGIFVIEAVVLVVGGLAWEWQYFLAGLLAPVGILLIDGIVRYVRWAPFQASWWVRRYEKYTPLAQKDLLLFQVTVLTALVCGSLLIGWGFRSLLKEGAAREGNNIILVLLMVVAFVGVAIACWTTLPQVFAVEEARVRAENLNQDLEVRVEERTLKLSTALQDLEQAQVQLVHSEKMSSLGQLVAGIAHEINNPVNFIYGNLDPASQYIQDLLSLAKLSQKHFSSLPKEIQESIEQVDIDFVQADLPKLMASMKIGAERIRQIVISLRNFSRLDEAEVKSVDIHEGIESTLLILQSRLKGRAGEQEIQVIKEYENLPPVECYAGQLNQVFMNLIGNAIDALEIDNSEKTKGEGGIKQPIIRIRTEVVDSHQVLIQIADNGPGIPGHIQSRLFDPFFTTKPVGKGTGLGLSISYQIIVEKHGGRLYCESNLGKGSVFKVEIPVRQEGLSVV